MSFATKIVLVTLVPWSVFLVSYLASFRPMPLYLIALILGGPHVLATTGLYADPDLRAHVRQNASRYVGAALAVILITTLAFTFSTGMATWYLLGGYLLWQTHHFTKQNIGMFAFWCRSSGVAGMASGERRLILATDVIGGLGILRMVGLWPELNDLFRLGGMAAIVVATGAAVSLSSGAPWQRRAALVATVAFYAPLHVFDVNLGAAALAYQAAHGAQYYLMVGKAVSARRQTLRLTVMVVLLGTLLFVPAARAHPNGSDAWMFGLAKGIVGAHFVADAGFWRLRDPQVRTYLKSRFDFL